MTQRVLIGQLGSGVGLWCSKPGYDVTTATQANLTFDMSSRSEQLLQFGFIGSAGVPVALGYSAAPVVIINDIGNTYGEAALIRPFLYVDWANKFSRAVISTSSFVIQSTSSSYNDPGTVAPRVGYIYFVYRRRL